MQAITAQILTLALVNGVLLLCIGLVVMENPFRVGTLVAVLLANCSVFFLAAVLSCDSPAAAMRSFGAKLVPVGVVFAAFALIILFQMSGRPRRERARRRPSRFIR
jgi:hypothetical protein